MSQDNHDLLVIKRWLPNHFEDILWSHIEHRTRNMPDITKPEPVPHNATMRQVGKTLGKRVYACEDPCESTTRRCVSKAENGKEVYASLPHLYVCSLLT